MPTTAPNPMQAPKVEREDRAAVQDATVLIVDDQPVNIQLLKVLLRDAGYTRIVATTEPRDALALYLAHQPDIVLLDLQMPHLDGFGVMAQLRQHEGSGFIPILVLTAETDLAVRYRALQSGARDFLNKPFDRIETAARIRNLIELRQLYLQKARHAAELELKVAERTRELRDTQQEIIHRLGHAAEYKDNETGNHIIRMSLYARVLARRAGLSELEQEMVTRAAPMHDIGKIGIPDRILLKPGPLTADEWHVMRTHAEIGADLLSGSSSPLIQLAQTIALTHHERWDGNGYPRKLAGTDIPLVGRIVAVADVFDALTSVRPYKRAWTVEESKVEMLSGAGRHFDPELVSLFFSDMAEILDIRQNYRED